ncbi:amidase family protein [Pseudomonas sp. Leaf58]|uniref:amidase family protein n=1 Tax=Pseudomonas sp. Leaf58 TaxID=1736226 RepID=UPI0009E67F0D|nr:amidase family protein [Pseudomonas sp. Leaf58]
MNKLASLLIFMSLGMASAQSATAKTGPFFDGPVFSSLIPPDENDFASARELQQRMANGEVTSVQLVERALARIRALDREGPNLHAVVEINPDALTIANTLDQERAVGRLRGPLHGLPILLKDNIDTGDSMQTSSGSLALIGQPAREDAAVVKRLRQAGAVVLGKANGGELAGFRDWGIPLGWSGRGGQVRNPWGLNLAVCGSSAGPAVAVAAGFVSLSVGTETNGSLICPAHANLVVGLRPTLGLVSQAGLVPLSSWQDTPGPMARTVTDIALLLGTMLEMDENTSRAAGGRHIDVDYLAKLDANALLGRRLGYPRYRPDGSLTIDHPHFSRLASVLEQAGATLVPVHMVIPDLFEEQIAVINHDLKRELGRYLQGRAGIEAQSLMDIIAFNREHPGPEGYGQGLLEGAQAQDLDEPAYWLMAHKLRNVPREMFDSVTRRHVLDALLDLPDGDLRGAGAQAGYPGLHVPAGLDDSGQPVGMYFSGLPYTEVSLLTMGFAFEQALKVK